MGGRLAGGAGEADREENCSLAAMGVHPCASLMRSTCNLHATCLLVGSVRATGTAAPCTCCYRPGWSCRSCCCCSHGGKLDVQCLIDPRPALPFHASQVEALTAELVQVQQRAVDRTTLEAAQAAQREAEARANSLTAEREGIAREVEAMQAALLRLQAEAAGESAARQKLGRLRSTLEGVRSEKALLEGQLTHAEAKVAELRDRLEQREVGLGLGTHGLWVQTFSTQTCAISMMDA